MTKLEAKKKGRRNDENGLTIRFGNDEAKDTLVDRQMKEQERQKKKISLWLFFLPPKEHGNRASGGIFLAVEGLI